MRQCRGSSEQHQRATAQVHLCEAAFNKTRDVLLRHALLQRSKCRTEHVEGRCAGQSHELEFVRRLVRTASDRDGIGGYVFESRSRLAEMIEKSEPSGFFDANAARANALIGKRGGSNFRRALIFLPDADFERKTKLLAKAAFFKARHDEDRSSRAGNDQAHQPLAKSPTYAGEVVQRSAGSEEQRVILRGRVRHQTLCALNALAEFFTLNGTYSRA